MLRGFLRLKTWLRTNLSKSKLECQNPILKLAARRQYWRSGMASFLPGPTGQETVCCRTPRSGIGTENILWTLGSLGSLVPLVCTASPRALEDETWIAAPRHRSFTFKWLVRLATIQPSQPFQVCGILGGQRKGYDGYDFAAHTTWHRIQQEAWPVAKGSLETTCSMTSTYFNAFFTGWFKLIRLPDSAVERFHEFFLWLTFCFEACFGSLETVSTRWHKKCLSATWGAKRIYATLFAQVYSDKALKLGDPRQESSDPK